MSDLTDGGKSASSRTAYRIFMLSCILSSHFFDPISIFFILFRACSQPSFETSNISTLSLNFSSTILSFSRPAPRNPQHTFSTSICPARYGQAASPCRYSGSAFHQSRSLSAAFSPLQSIQPQTDHGHRS